MVFPWKKMEIWFSLEKAGIWFPVKNTENGFPLICIFPCFDRVQRFTLEIPGFRQNEGKCKSGKTVILNVLCSVCVY